MKYILTLLISLLIAGNAFAAGSCTVTPSTEQGLIGANVITYTCTADAADGSFPATSTTAAVHGFVTVVDVVEGTTAPTDDYDITITDASGLDVMGGELADLTTDKQAMPKAGGYLYRPVNSALTLNVSNNSVNSAGITVRVWLEK